MRRRPSRLVRIVRVRVKRFARRLDRQTPEWMRWLTPWGTSVSLHLAALLVLAIVVVANSGDSEQKVIESTLPGQLVDDVTSLFPADQAGDPFAAEPTEEPPSLAFEPSDSSLTNLPELPPEMLLSKELQLTPKAREAPASPTNPGFGPSLKSYVEPSAPFAGRQGAAKAKLVRREGGSAESERAVERGLDWIARHQKKDGSWSLNHKPQCKGKGCPADPHMESDTAATGLALLPLLGAGQSHVDPGRYREAVDAGIHWLLKIQKPDGDLWTGGGGNTHMYSHAIGAMALCEAYGITRDPKLKRPAEQAIGFIVQAQSHADGGWRYNPGEAGDTSVLGWQMFALRSAHLAGLEVPKKTIAGAIDYLDKAAADPERTTYGYQPTNPATPVMTAESLLIRQYLGWGRDYPPMREGAGKVAAHLFESKERNVYYWYYATQLLHNMQGKAWKRWNFMVRDGLVAMQVKGDGCDRGSWHPRLPLPDRWGAEAGRHFTTALSVMTLEVYYRYLPLYQHSQPGRDLADRDRKPGG